MKTKKDLIFADEVYEIVGMMYEVYDLIGYGHKESFYQKAVAEIFRKNKKKFVEQLRVNLKMGETVLGEYRFDFLYENKIVIELKQGENFLKQNINQVYSYLKAKNLKLGLLINFTKKGIKFKRIVNLY
ncbi:MAG: GxxExxY protein [Candidatus Moraniibacteriota bacterium]